MALPDSLADLFGSKSTLPAAPESSSLLNLGYTITWEPLNDGTTPPELSAQLPNLYEARFPVLTPAAPWLSGCAS